MIIRHLSLSNFRNYPKKNISFSSINTIFVGNNASGKTNLLEAVFSLATGGSFRTESDREMIQLGEEIGRVKGEINKPASSAGRLGNVEIKGREEEINLEIVLTGGQVMGMKAPFKRYLVNGVGKRGMDFVGNLKVVLFWPEDLELVTDSPSLRRRYLDSVLVQADREYRRSLISYEKGLRQRNKVLEAVRDHGAHRHQLLFWDQLLIKTGDYITKKREEYINFINKSETSSASWRIKSEINSNFQNSKYQIEYDRSIISESRLVQYSEEEIAAAATLVGPHRDDVIFKIKNQSASWRTKIKNNEDEYRNLSHFGSRGEQRLAVLWLKLEELAYIEETTRGKPVLLLDDIFSELDHEHRKIIFDVIGKQQTIMTTTDEHFIDHKSLQELKVIKL